MIQWYIRDSESNNDICVHVLLVYHSCVTQHVYVQTMNTFMAMIGIVHNPPFQFLGIGIVTSAWHHDWQISIFVIQFCQLQSDSSRCRTYKYPRLYRHGLLAISNHAISAKRVYRWLCQLLLVGIENLRFPILNTERYEKELRDVVAPKNVWFGSRIIRRS